MELFICLILAMLLILFFVWQDTSITISRIDYRNKKISKSFEGFRILQISDLHNAQFGKGNQRLLSRIESEQPDIIVVTGDVYDRRRPNLKIAADFLKNAAQICPTYYISGNHENWSGQYESFREMIKDSGVKGFDGCYEQITRGEDRIGIYGAGDSSIQKKSTEQHPTGHSNQERTSLVLEKLKERQKKGDILSILLSHRPELFSIYAAFQFDLTFCGHAHGGQFRIPFIGGVYAPNQGFFPNYTSGIHKIEHNASMVVSRGLGNSLIPIRVFNRPEIVIVTLIP